MKTLSELLRSQRKGDRSRLLVCIALGVSVLWLFVDRFGLACVVSVSRAYRNETLLDALFIASCFVFCFANVAIITARVANQLIEYFYRKKRSIS
jgi:hypothetical protein